MQMGSSFIENCYKKRRYWKKMEKTKWENRVQFPWKERSHWALVSLGVYRAMTVTGWRLRSSLLRLASSMDFYQLSHMYYVCSLAQPRRRPCVVCILLTKLRVVRVPSHPSLSLVAVFLVTDIDCLFASYCLASITTLKPSRYLKRCLLYCLSYCLVPLCASKHGLYFHMPGLGGFS